MENKKAAHADITKKSALFMMIGLVTSLAITVAAFEWKDSNSGELMDLGVLEEDFPETLEIPPTEHLPKEPPKVKNFTIIDIPDDEIIEEIIDFDLDIDISEDTEINDIVFEPEPADEDYDKVVLFVEEEASFPGGKQA